MSKAFIITSLLIITWATGLTQSVGIGTKTPDPSAVLELKATNKGFLPPRMTASEKGLLPAPKAGLLIYQTDGTKGLYVYNGTAWEAVAGSGPAAPAGGWSLTGNAGTNPSTSFIGTTDNKPLKFRVSNTPAGIISTDEENIGLGLNTLVNNTVGGMNNAIGSQALVNNTTGYHNNALGRRALFANTTGGGNIAIGTSTLSSNINGEGNTAVGNNAAYSNVSGFSNVAIGTKSLFKNTEGRYLTAIGDSALYNNTGIENVAVGSKAMYANTTGIFNTGIGNRSLYNNTSGSQNTALGRGSLYFNQTGNQNTAIGFQASYNNIYASRNTAVGYNSLLINEAGSDNTGVGYNTLLKSLKGGNTAIGSSALTESTEGSRLTAVGYTALEKNTTGESNTAVGALSLRANVNGSVNSTFGDFSLTNNINGSYNTALGAAALNTNISGNYNTGVGYKAEVYGSNYSNATSVGAFAQAGCSNCVVLGSVAGYNGAAVTAKVGIGTINPQQALHVSPNGAGGILIGEALNTGGYTALNMGISQSGGGYSYIQSVKAAGTTYGDLVLNPSGGNVAIGKSTASTPLHVKQTTDNFPYNGSFRLERHDNGNFWDISVSYADVLHLVYKGVEKVRFSNIDGDIWQSSDLRLKKDVQNFENALPRLMKLEAKSYHYRDNEDGSPLSYGFIAQDVEKIFPGAVSNMGKDGMKAIAYQKLNILAIKSIQEQQVIIEAQQKQIDLSKQQALEMMEAIKKLQKEIARINKTKI